MLDRLVYVLFFIFVGSGLFLIYQGLNGMGYFGTPAATPAVTSSPANPAVPVKVPSEKVTKPTQPVEAIGLEDLEAVVFVTENLSEDELTQGAEFFVQKLMGLKMDGDGAEVNRFVALVNPVLKRISSRHDLALYLDKALPMVAKLVAEKKAFDWNTQEAVELLSVAVGRLTQSGHFAILLELYTQVLPTLRMKLPIYRDKGREIESSFCLALKKMGRSSSCMHLYTEVNSPNVQVYSLASRAVYDGDYGRLWLYADRMKEYKDKGQWIGYENYLYGLYFYHIKQNYKAALESFSERVELRNGKFRVFESLESYLYLSRSFWKLRRYQESLTNIDGALEQLSLESHGPSYAGMMLILQKMVLAHLMTITPDVQNLRAKFLEFKPDDPFGDDALKAFDALASKNVNYKAPYDNYEFKEVEELLGAQSGQ